MEKESKSMDSTEALGLYSKKPIGNTEEGMAKGNDAGNQQPVAQTKSIGGGFKTK